MFPYMYVCCMCAWSLQKAEEGMRFLRTGATDGCDLPCGC